MYMYYYKSGVIGLGVRFYEVVLTTVILLYVKKYLPRITYSRAGTAGKALPGFCRIESEGSSGGTVAATVEALLAKNWLCRPCIGTINICWNAFNTQSRPDPTYFQKYFHYYFLLIHFPE